MRRLFKEVFKSLAKNKITMICLTILIFITSGIFTLFLILKQVIHQQWILIIKFQDYMIYL